MLSLQGVIIFYYLSLLYIPGLSFSALLRNTGQFNTYNTHGAPTAEAAAII